MAERDNEDDSNRGNIKEYLDNCDFHLEDTPGQEEVVLRRTLGDEKYAVLALLAPPIDIRSAMLTSSLPESK